MSRIITRMTRGRISYGSNKKVLVSSALGNLYFKRGSVAGKGAEVDYAKIKHERILQEDKEILLMIKAIVEHELF